MSDLTARCAGCGHVLATAILVRCRGCGALFCGWCMRNRHHEEACGK